MSEREEPRDPVETLAEEFVQRLREGDHVSVSQYAAAHPEHAEQIRELFPTIAAVEGVKKSDSPSATLGAVRLERLGDFRIIHEIGRGGMGIVYEAEQESLGRRIAIKVLPPRVLEGDAQSARFSREARLAARLHHTNIVPIFGVGQQDGFHYYVMQLIRGVGLDRIVAALASMDGRQHGRPPASTAAKPGRRPGYGDSASTEQQVLSGMLKELSGKSMDRAEETGALADSSLALPVGQSPKGPRYWRFVARIGLQIADALHYAHAQGTLHRDIKPANVLVDARGTAWVTDFGLARALKGDGGVPDDVGGTPRYMAPEQFAGRAEAATDIYGLGLTLYELLTLMPAFAQSDRTVLVYAIGEGQCKRPRELDAGIPRDLEAIVLKAIAPEPAGRYGSASAMADDLRRFLEGRPVDARRISPPERLWRWCKRSPAVASLTVATLTLALTVAVVASVGYLRTRQALAGEAKQRARSDATVALAQEALDRIFDRLGFGPVLTSTELTLDDSDGTSIAVPSSPVISRETASLLEEMLPFYDRLAEQSDNDARVRLRAAEANMRIGNIRQRLGQYDLAVNAYQRGARILEQMQAQGSSGIVVRLAEIHNEAGRVYRARRQDAEAQRAHEQALGLLSGNAASVALFECARAHYFLGVGRLPDPGSRPPGPDIHRGPPRGFGPEGGPRGHAHDRPGGPSERGMRFPSPDLAREMSERSVRQEHLRQAIALLEELTRRSPAVPEYRRLLAMAHRDGVVLLRPHDGPRAEELSKRAIDIFEQLIRDYPQVADYRHGLCEAYAMVDMRMPGVSRDSLGECEERLRKALAIAEALVAEYPQVPDYRVSQAQIYHRLYETLRRMRRMEDGERYARKAIAVQAMLVDQFANVPSHRVWLAAFRNALAELLVGRNQPAEARQITEGTVEMLKQLLSEQTDMTYLHALLGDSYRTMAATFHRTGDMENAARFERLWEESRQKLRGMGGRPPRPGPRDER